MLIFFAVLGGFVLDAIFGDPLWLPHPVVYMGKVISFLDRSLRKILPKTPRGERIGGAITAFILSAHSCFPARCAFSFIKFTGCSDF